MVALFLALALCWLTFDKLIGIRFTNADDMLFSITSFKDYFAVAGKDAANTGRFSMYYAWVYFMLTPAFWNTPILDIAMYGPVAAVMVGLVGLTYYLGHVRFGLLFVALFLAFIPVTYGFNLLVSYPFRYTSGIILWLAALFSIESYLRHNKIGYLWAACVLSFIAYAHHETLFAIFASAGIIFVMIRQNAGSLRQRLSHPAVRALLATSLLYAIIFVAWYATHPPTYAGNTIKFDGRGFLSGYGHAIAYYVGASLPLFHFFHGYALPFIAGGTDLYAAIPVSPNLVSVLGNLNAEQVVRALLIALIFLASVAKLPSHSNSTVVRGVLAMGLAILVLPAAIISLSYAYQALVRGGYAPLHVAFFGYFGSILLICTAIIFLLIPLPSTSRKFASYVLAMLIVAGAIATDVFNVQVSEAMQLNSERWNVAATLIRHFAVSPSPTLMVAPQLWNYAGSPGSLPENYWQRLFEEKAGLDIQFSPLRLSHMPKLSATLYYDCSGPKDCLIMLQWQQNHVTEVITTSPRPRFLTYSERNNAKAVTVVPILRQPPTLLHPGIYTATLPAQFTELSKWRVIM
jgi:hypothetical protein